jgi:hypothetical protein
MRTADIRNDTFLSASAPGSVSVPGSASALKREGAGDHNGKSREPNVRNTANQGMNTREIIICNFLDSAHSPLLTRCTLISDPVVTYSKCIQHTESWEFSIDSGFIIWRCHHAPD